MRVLIQRSTDGLFLKAEGEWAATKENGLDFRNCAPAIDFCVEHGLKGARLWVSFEDSKKDFPMEVFQAETRIVGRALLARMGSVHAETKEGKKQFAFPRKLSGADSRMNPETPCESSGALDER